MTNIKFDYYIVIINYKGVRCYFLANLVESIVATIISFVMVHYSLKISSFKNNFLKLLKPAIPMIPVSVSAWSLTLVDRAILGKLSLGGMVDVGIYGFAVKMASLPSVLWGPFQLAWMPFALSSFKEDGGIRVLEKASAWFFYSSYLIIILISLLSPIIISGFFPPEYLIAAKYVGPLVLCNFFLHGLLSSIHFFDSNEKTIAYNAGLCKCIVNKCHFESLAYS